LYELLEKKKTKSDFLKQMYDLSVQLFLCNIF